MYEIVHLLVQDGRGILCLEFVHGDIEHLQVRVPLFDLHADGLCYVGLSESRVAEHVERIVGRVAGIDRDRHAGRTRQAVAIALYKGVERVVGVELGVDDDFPYARNDERILYIRRVGLLDVFRDRSGVRLLRVDRGLRMCLVFVVGDGVAQFGPLAEGLIDDRPQKRNVVLLYMVNVGLVGHPQLQRSAVEIDRHDGLEPLDEFLLRGLLPDAGQAVLPHIAVCRIIDDHKIAGGFFEYKSVPKIA